MSRGPGTPFGEAASLQGDAGCTGPKLHRGERSGHRLRALLRTSGRSDAIPVPVSKWARRAACARFAARCADWLTYDGCSPIRSSPPQPALSASSPLQMAVSEGMRLTDGGAFRLSSHPRHLAWSPQTRVLGASGACRRTPGLRLLRCLAQLGEYLPAHPLRLRQPVRFGQGASSSIQLAGATLGPTAQAGIELCL